LQRDLVRVAEARHRVQTAAADDSDFRLLQWIS
jgi:hypothetical protein